VEGLGRERNEVNEGTDEDGRRCEKRGTDHLEGAAPSLKRGKEKGSSCVVYGRSNGSQLGRATGRSEQGQRPAGAICSSLPLPELSNRNS
jgi:hypothetical protein